MLAMDAETEVRTIVLPKGGTLELDVRPGFYDRVRAHFRLQPEAGITDDHLRMFVFGAFKGAVDKAEGANG